MGLFKNLKDSVAMAKAAATGTFDQEAIDRQLATLSPEQRAAYDANMADVARRQEAANAEWHATRAAIAETYVLRGRAGMALYGAGMTGPDPNSVQQIMQGGGGWREVMRQTQAMTNASDPVAEQAMANQIEDAHERARVSGMEVAARGQARQPYRAPQPPPIVFTRIPSRGGTQVDDVRAFLRQSGLGGRPDLVYGVYRVPDRISPTLTSHSEKGRVVEWDIVHVPVQLPPSPYDVVAEYFPAKQRLVARRLGEPSLLDEEVAGIYLNRARIAPEQCCGVARFPHFRDIRGGQSETSYPKTIVEGVLVFHPAIASAQGVADQMEAQAPLSATPDTMLRVHIEVLTWREIGQVVNPASNRDYLVPSPFAHLPSTPQELLFSYLDVVGVASGDCYSAQVTVDDVREIYASWGKWGGSTNTAPDRPCADGKQRGRMHAAQDVVVMYRDRPEYVAGRQRWAAYQQNVLEAELTRGTATRRPVDDPEDVSGIFENRVLDGGLKAFAKVARVIDMDFLGEKIPPHRYVWPPVP